MIDLVKKGADRLDFRGSVKVLTAGGQASSWKRMKGGGRLLSPRLSWYDRKRRKPGRKECRPSGVESRGDKSLAPPFSGRKTRRGLAHQRRHLAAAALAAHGAGGAAAIGRDLAGEVGEGVLAALILP